jgi:hypothetical protein
VRIEAIEEPSFYGGFPIEEREIGDHALHRGCGVVARFTRRAAAVVLADRDTSTIGIEQDLLVVEALTGYGIAWSVGAIA